jgi:hypothetical protein
MLNLISIYGLIGLGITAFSDYIHYLTKDYVDEETYEKNTLTNWDRILMVSLWPLFTLLIIKEIIFAKKK